MADKNNELMEMIYKAKNNSREVDNLVRLYMGFIKSETTKFLGREAVLGQDDELSIAMIAFHEAVLDYSRFKGPFINYARLHIKHRLIDFYRKEKRHRGLISLDKETEYEDSPALVDTLEETKNELEEFKALSDTKAEIKEYSTQLEKFSVDLTEIAENTPKQKRTLNACFKALEYMVNDSRLMENFLKTRKIPITEISKNTKVDKKTLERHRKYLVAITLAYTNGYDIIRNHIKGINPKKEGENP